MTHLRTQARWASERPLTTPDVTSCRNVLAGGGTISIEMHFANRSGDVFGSQVCVWPSQDRGCSAFLSLHGWCSLVVAVPVSISKRSAPSATGRLKCCALLC